MVMSEKEWAEAVHQCQIDYFKMEMKLALERAGMCQRTINDIEARYHVT
jgi:hypothetical protein